MKSPAPNTKTIGKIVSLPVEICDQLNRRLHQGEKPKELLAWLNALPEVQAVLATEFEGKPITKQNLSEWKHRGFRHWRLRQDALQFAQTAQADDTALQQALPGQLSDTLSRWATVRYAAAANALSSQSDDPRSDLRLLREFCSDVVALRRGDLLASRIQIEQQRLAMELADTADQREKDFWEWTQRPDIRAKLYPHRDPDKMRRDVDRMLTERLLGIRRPAEDEEIDPACLI